MDEENKIEYGLGESIFVLVPDKTSQYYEIKSGIIQGYEHIKSVHMLGDTMHRIKYNVMVEETGQIVMVEDMYVSKSFKELNAINEMCKEIVQEHRGRNE